MMPGAGGIKAWLHWVILDRVRVGELHARELGAVPGGPAADSGEMIGRARAHMPGGGP